MSRVAARTGGPNREASLERTRQRMGPLFRENQVLGRRNAIGCVALEITQRCNLDCTLCYLSENSERVKDVPLAEIFRRIDAISDQFGAPTSVQITGGDPSLLLHGHDRRGADFHVRPQRPARRVHSETTADPDRSGTSSLEPPLRENASRRERIGVGIIPEEKRDEKDSLAHRRPSALRGLHGPDSPASNRQAGFPPARKSVGKPPGPVRGRRGEDGFPWHGQEPLGPGDLPCLGRDGEPRVGPAVLPDAGVQARLLHQHLQRDRHVRRLEIEFSTGSRQAQGHLLLQESIRDRRALHLSVRNGKQSHPAYGDPRVHVALNCMARGCPRLPREPFEPQKLDAQLDRQAKQFYNEKRNVDPRPDVQTVRLSQILQFYTEDFTRKAPSLIAYVNQYREEKIPTGWRVEFIPYDWTLNTQ